MTKEKISNRDSEPLLEAVLDFFYDRYDAELDDDEYDESALRDAIGDWVSAMALSEQPVSLAQVDSLSLRVSDALKDCFGKGLDDVDLDDDAHYEPLVNFLYDLLEPYVDRSHAPA